MCPECSYQAGGWGWGLEGLKKVSKVGLEEEMSDLENKGLGVRGEEGGLVPITSAWKASSSCLPHELLFIP